MQQKLLSLMILWSKNSWQCSFKNYFFLAKKTRDIASKGDFLNWEKAKSDATSKEGAFLASALGSSVLVLEEKIKTAYNIEDHTIVFIATLIDSNNDRFIQAGTNVKDITAFFAS